MLDSESLRIVYRAQTTDTNTGCGAEPALAVELFGHPDDLEELAGYVAAEANQHDTPSQQRQQLYSICDLIDTAITE